MYMRVRETGLMMMMMNKLFSFSCLNSPYTPSKPVDLNHKHYIKGLPSKYNQSITIQHWQLRDLIQAPRSPYEFFSVYQNSVKRYLTKTGESSSLFKDLNFVPTSITMGQGFAAAGGQQGQLALKDLESSYTLQANVGGSINNSLVISSINGGDQPCLFVCNNDETIKVYGLPSLNLIKTLQVPTACNHAAISPDGRNLIAVGDSNDVFLFDIRGQTFTLTQTLQATSEASFSCSWNRFGDTFAVASQDGYVSVFDIRHGGDTLAKLASKQSAPVKGACRCVKFAPSGPIDLLVFSEHVNYVHLIDSRTFQDRELVRISPSGVDQHISGVTFTPDSKRLFIGTDSSVYDYEIDTISQRSFHHGSLL